MALLVSLLCSVALLFLLICAAPSVAGKSSVDLGRTGKTALIDESRSGTYFYHAGQLYLAKRSKGQIFGRVSVSKNFCIQFEIYIYNFAPKGTWKNILHVGISNGHRSPGVWLYPTRPRLHFRFADTVSTNNGYDPNFDLRTNKWYNIKFCIVDQYAKFWVDNKLWLQRRNVVHYTRYRAPVWMTNPWYTGASVMIRSVEMWAPET